MSNARVSEAVLEAVRGRGNMATTQAIAEQLEQPFARVACCLASLRRKGQVQIVWLTPCRGRLGGRWWRPGGIEVSDAATQAAPVDARASDIDYARRAGVPNPEAVAGAVQRLRDAGFRADVDDVVSAVSRASLNNMDLWERDER